MSPSAASASEPRPSSSSQHRRPSLSVVIPVDIAALPPNNTTIVDAAALRVGRDYVVHGEDLTLYAILRWDDIQREVRDFLRSAPSRSLGRFLKAFGPTLDRIKLSLRLIFEEAGDLVPTRTAGLLRTTHQTLFHVAPDAGSRARPPLNYFVSSDGEIVYVLNLDTRPYNPPAGSESCHSRAKIVVEACVMQRLAALDALIMSAAMPGISTGGVGGVEGSGGGAFRVVAEATISFCNPLIVVGSRRRVNATEIQSLAIQNALQQPVVIEDMYVFDGARPDAQARPTPEGPPQDIELVCADDRPLQIDAGEIYQVVLKLPVASDAAAAAHAPLPSLNLLWRFHPAIPAILSRIAIARNPTWLHQSLFLRLEITPAREDAASPAPNVRELEPFAVLLQGVNLCASAVSFAIELPPPKRDAAFEGEEALIISQRGDKAIQKLFKKYLALNEDGKAVGVHVLDSALSFEGVQPQGSFAASFACFGLRCGLYHWDHLVVILASGARWVQPVSLSVVVIAD